MSTVFFTLVSFSVAALAVGFGILVRDEPAAKKRRPTTDEDWRELFIAMGLIYVGAACFLAGAVVGIVTEPL